MIGKKRILTISISAAIALAAAGAFATSQGVFAASSSSAPPPAASAGTGANHPHKGQHKKGHHKTGRHSVIPGKQLSAYLKLTPVALKTDLRNHTLAQVAAGQGISQSALTAELQTLFNAKVQAAVKAGHMAQAKATATEQRVDQQFGKWVAQKHHWLQTAKRSGHKQHGKPHGTTAKLLGQVAKDLKMTRQALLADVHAGQTIAQVAAAHGSSAAALQQSLQASAAQHLDKTISHFLNRKWQAPKKA